MAMRAGKGERSICWDCRHAVPKKIFDLRIWEDRYVRGCEWSIHKQPVAGWDAEERTFPMAKGGEMRCFWVKHCPKFERGAVDETKTSHKNRSER